VSKRWKGVDARGREGEGKRVREREGQLANSWLVVVGPPARRRHPGAEVTLCNNSFCFMSWVVYTLCLPRDRHAARGAGRGGSGSLSFPLPALLSKTRRFATALRCLWRFVVRVMS